MHFKDLASILRALTVIIILTLLVHEVLSSGCESERTIAVVSYTSSSVVGSCEAVNGYLLNEDTVCKGWCVLHSDQDWLQLRFKKQKLVTSVATKGSGKHGGNVKKFSLAFSTDETDWWDYMVDGEVKVFSENLPGDKDTAVHHSLPVQVQARFIRFKPIDSEGRYTCLRAAAYGCNAPYCGSVGIKDGRIPDSAMTSTKPSSKAFEPYLARLDQDLGNGSWCSRKIDTEDHLRIDLGTDYNIDRIKIQGGPYSFDKVYQNRTAPCNSTDPNLEVVQGDDNVMKCYIPTLVTDGAWVAKFKIDYSLDGVMWRPYGRHGVKSLTFIGNDRYPQTRELLIFPYFRARHVAIRPTKAVNQQCLRLELYGCEACRSPIGISHGKVPNDHMSASSSLNPSTKPWYARLKNPQKAWCSEASDSNPYLQIDLFINHKIVSIETKGFPLQGSWVKQYKVRYSVDGDHWHFHQENGTDMVFTGNSDAQTVKNNTLTPAVYAVFVRIIPITWNGTSPCLRVELYGCSVASDPLGLDSKEVTSIDSNAWHTHREAWRGSLRKTDGWAAPRLMAPEYTFIQVDFGPSLALITGIATSFSDVYYVQEYTLRYSDHRVEWKVYTENGYTKVFGGNNASNPLVRHNFRHNITGRYLMVVVKKSMSRIGLRMELYGLKVCQNPLGMTNGLIVNASIVASMDSEEGFDPWNARLNGPSAWCPETFSPGGFLQISLVALHKITALEIQGYQPNDTLAAYVKEFNIRYLTLENYWHWFCGSYTTEIFYTHLESGNMTKFITLSRAIITSKIRIYPTVVKKNSCIRLEIYGCLTSDLSCSSPVGLKTHVVSQQSITASSSLGKGYHPTNGRLGTNIGFGAWCAATQDGQQFLQIDFGVIYVITGIATQGKHLLSKDDLGFACVNSFKLEYSQYGVRYSSVIDSNDQPKVFTANSRENITAKHVLTKAFKGRFVKIRPISWFNKICIRVELYGCRDCFSPLGIEEAIIANGRFRGNVWTAHKDPFKARFSYRHNFYGYNELRPDTFLEIQFPDESKYISAMAVEGAEDGAVTAYSVSYSPNGVDWLEYMENGELKVFDGPFRKYVVTTNTFVYPLKLKHIKLHVLKVFLYPHMRIELFGCAEPSYAVGLQSRKLVPDSKFTASSSDTQNKHFAYNARFGYHGGWCPVKGGRQSLTVDLGKTLFLCKFTFKGNPVTRQFTSKVRIYYRNGEHDWKMYVNRAGHSDLNINIDYLTTATLRYKFPLRAYQVRFFTVGWSSRSCLRVEIYQCKECQDEVHTSKEFSSTYGMSASTQFDRTFSAIYGSMRMGDLNVAWCAALNDAYQHLQFDNILNYKITGITTLGMGFAPNGTTASWVTKYHVIHSIDGNNWSEYRENSNETKVFNGSDNHNVPSEQSLTRPFVARYVRLIPIKWQNWICMRVSLHGCEDGSSPIGIEQHLVKDLKGSDYHDSPHYGRLHSGKAFRPSNEMMLGFYQIGLKISGVVIKAIAVQPCYACSNEGAWSYYLSYSPYGVSWTNYLENGTTRIFSGMRDRERALRFVLLQPITARFVRFYPTRWKIIASLRVEIYGYNACSNALGLSNSALPNSVLSASSYVNGHEARKGRLDSSGIWCSALTEVNDKSTYLQVDLYFQAIISGIVTSGDTATTSRVKVIVVSYIDDEGFWDSIGKYDANIQDSHLKKSWFPRLIKTKTVRVLPESYHHKPCMKIELLGCKDEHHNCNTPVGVESALIKNDSLSASSTLGPRFKPWYGRLNAWIDSGGWCARLNESDQYMEVHLKEDYKITSFILQGVGTSWVDVFSVDYSLNGYVWITHKEDNNQSFDGVSPGNLTTEKTFDAPFVARYIRVRARHWHRWICMRIEFRGCRVAKPLGSESHEMENKDFSAVGAGNAERARLYHTSYWYASHNTGGGEYLILTIWPYGRTITAIAMQGYQNFITVFTVEYSKNGGQWYDYVINGNVKLFKNTIDTYMASRHILPRPLTASWIKLSPIQSYDRPRVRLELFGFDTCLHPLGVDSLPQSAFTASGNLPGFEPWRAKLNGPVGHHWCSHSSGKGEFLAIDIGMVYIIAAIGIEGDVVGNNYVHGFHLYYKEEERETWQKYGVYTENGFEMELISRPSVTTPRVLMKLRRKVQARHVKMSTFYQIGKPCMRVEFYGCKVCSEDLGMASYELKDDAITASGFFNPLTAPYMARLNSTRGLGAWCAGQSETRPYLQIDLFWVRQIHKMAIQGRKDNAAWVETFSLSYREDDQDWLNYTGSGTVQVQELQGNVNGNTVVTHNITILRARYLRIRPQTWHLLPCMRLEFYGCEAKEPNDKTKALGMQSNKIKNEDITASNFHSIVYSPYYARLHGTSGSWYAPIFTKARFLLIDLGLVKVAVSKVAVQGRWRCCNEISQFILAFSKDGLFFHPYTEHGKEKVFSRNKPKDMHVPVVYNLHLNIVTRYVKFKDAGLSSVSIGMRVEVYGVRATVNSLLTSKSADFQVVSNGNLTNLNEHTNSPTGVSWCTEFQDSKSFVAIRFERDVAISKISIDTTYQDGFFVFYSPSGQGLRMFKERGVTKIFHKGSYTFNKAIAAQRIMFKPTVWHTPLCVQVDVFGYEFQDPLLQRNQPSHHKITASSFRYPFEPSFGVFNLENVHHGWCTSQNDAPNYEYLKIDLLYLHVLSFIATQGVHATGVESWVSSYSVQYSEDDNRWIWYQESGEKAVKVLNGNSNAHLVVKHGFLPPIVARYVKIHPISWNGSICLRAEVFGYSGYLEALGMNTGYIPDSAIKATDSFSSTQTLPQFARLHRVKELGGWKANPSDEISYIQVDLGGSKMLTGIATQGAMEIPDNYVTSYNISYSEDNVTWANYEDNATTKVFNGNTNLNVVTHVFNSTFHARYVRLIVNTWNLGAALRLELLGQEIPIIDGGYAYFTNWTNCNVECGGGLQFRTRNCTNPVPSNGGQNCSGQSEEGRKCNTQLCPAPKVTAPKSLLSTNELANFTINNCNHTQLKIIDFGDQSNNISTNECFFQHNYTKPGIYELKVSIPRHEYFITTLYVQEKVAGLRIVPTSLNSLLGHLSVINFTLSRGTLPMMFVNFTDGSDVHKLTLRSVYDWYCGSIIHTFVKIGSHKVSIAVFNDISSMEVFTVVNIFDIINISSVSVSYLGIFDHYYQHDNLTVTVDLLTGSSPTYRYHMGNSIIITSKSPYLNYSYLTPGTYKLTVEVLNDASSENSTKTIEVFPVIPINEKAYIEANNTALSKPTCVTTYLDAANPYECMFNFGDGISSRILSTSTSTQYLQNVSHVYSVIGTYTITIKCYNVLSSRTMSLTIVIQRPITGLKFTNDGPKEMNETVTHQATATDWGTDSCIYFDFGDGSSKGYGKKHCHAKYLRTAFQEIHNSTYTFQNMYYEIKLFYDFIHAWNKISEFRIQNRLPIMKISCGYPNTSIVGLSKDIAAPMRIHRLSSLTLEAQTTVKCRATNIKDYSWSFFRTSTSNTQIGSEKSLSTAVAMFLKPKTMEYGLHTIRHNVSMHNQQGIWTISDVFVDVVPRDLFAVIDGGQEVERPYDKIVYFDGTFSNDPDYPGTSDFEFFWLISNDTSMEEKDALASTIGRPINQSPEYNEEDFCNMSLPRRLFKGGSRISLLTSKLELNETYVVFLVLMKTVAGRTRTKSAFQLVTVVEGDPPICGLRCVQNCQRKVVITDKHTVSVFCARESPPKPMTFSWELEIQSQSTVKQWLPIENLGNQTSTGLNKQHIVIKPNLLLGDRKYRLKANANVFGRRTARAFLEFTVNSPPRAGKCTVDLSSGLADYTNFTIYCHDWKDDDVPLTYQHSYRNAYGLTTTMYYGLKDELTSMLPIGDPNSNFMLVFYARVYDVYRSYAESEILVQVKPPSASKEAQFQDLASVLSTNESESMQLLYAGKVQEFTQSVNAKISILNHLSSDDRSEEIRRKGQEMRANVLKNLHSVQVDSIEAISQIGPTFAITCVEKEEVSVDSQKLILESSASMIDLLESKSKEGVGASEIEQASTTLAFLIGNLMAASGDSAKVYGSQSAKDDGTDVERSRESGKEIGKQSDNLVHKMTKSLLGSKVPGEVETIIKSPSMSIVVSRELPSQMGNKLLGDGDAQVGMPSSDKIFGDKTENSSFVDAEFLKFRENHITWDKSAEDITSSTVSLKLHSDNATELKVSGLSESFSLFIPRKSVQTSPITSQTFMDKKEGSVAFHRYNWTLDRIPLYIILRTNSSDVSIDIYFKKSKRPNVKRDQKYITLPNRSSCKIDKSGNEVCSQEPYAVTINESIVDEPGIYFMALEVRRSGAKTQSRTKRDCGVGGRQKRSCLQYKDPPERPPTPPPGFGPGGSLVDSVPTYDAERDMAYSLTTISSPCKYWDKINQVWTTEGCKTGKFTTLDVVHCLCNHLTEFGGGLLVAPNPIDFDKVWAGFSNISDNLAVLLTICSAFALYILIGILVHKKDKEDVFKGGTTFIESEDGRYFGASSNAYLVTVQTGAWKNSATTAKVHINIIGQKGQSGAISLQDETKQLFSRGAGNKFEVTLPSSLGPLLYLRVWHDMSGNDSSWYLSYVIIRDLNSDQQWVFVCERWLALDKDDGLVDRLIIASGNKELKKFKTLFRTKTSQDLFDGHLWLSVIGKPPKSNFTRLQRLSCCMSLLFTTMMTSAMFYNLPGGATDGSSVAIGPLRFSIRQLIIGIQSSFLALPVNILIIQIFRNVRPKPEKKDIPEAKEGCVVKFDGTSDCESEQKENNPEVKQKQGGFPYWTTYIAWTLCFLMTLTSAAITLFYSMMWGKETSEQWLTSMLVSFFQDAFVSQPIKVCGIALFVAAVLKTLPPDFKNANAKNNDSTIETAEFNPEDTVDFEPPDPELIEKARQYKAKENQMYCIMKENVFHVVLLFMLVIISYSDRDPMAFYQTNTLQNALSTEIGNPKEFWSYLNDTLLPFAYDGRTSKSDPALEGYTSDKNLYIIGMPRLRQQRVKKVPCAVKYIEQVCENFYSAFDEVQSFFLPGWRKMSNLTLSACPEPWRYKGLEELNGIPYWGQANIYGGGGYTANLGYNTDQAQRVISEIKLNKWIDEQTRAIFIEFTVYNAYANLFSVLTNLVEMQGLGGSISLLRVETFRLYPNPGPNDSIVVICQFSVMVITLISAYINCKKIYHLRREYFKNFWHIIQIFIILLTFICIGLVIVRKINAERTIQNVYDNPFVFICFQYTTQWATINTYVIALIVFLTTLKFLYLMSFNRHIVVLYKTVVRATPRLQLLAVEALVLFISLVSFSYLYFGRYTNGFGSLFLTVQSLLAMMLGKAYFDELSQNDFIVGPIFFGVFAIFMVFFLLNIFMAVLMDTYAEVSEGTTTSNNKDFEIADFMVQRLKVLVGVSKPIGQPWSVPRLEYIPTVDKKTQKRLDLEKNMDDLPKRVQGIHRSLVDLESINTDIDLVERELVEFFITNYDVRSVNSDDDSSTIVSDYVLE